MKRRNATTLVEVLVAIFVMAIGLMTLLTLFPLGALSMSQAIKDDRTAHAAGNAAAFAEAMNVRNGLYGFFRSGYQPPDPDPFLNPDAGAHNGLPNLATISNYDGPSYPVYVDPLGYSLGSIYLTNTPKNIPRRTMSSPSPPSTAANPRPLASVQEIYRWFSLLDDMNFASDGPNQGLPSSPVEREGRYTWAYLLRRPRFSEQKVVDLTVVVYSGRPGQLPLGEHISKNVLFDPASNFVTLNATNYGTDKPAIRKGSWIMDATLLLPSGRPEIRGYFYRVVGVTENTPGTLQLELQTNPRGTATGSSSSNAFGVLVFFDNVAEVFEKGAGWRP